MAPMAGFLPFSAVPSGAWVTVTDKVLRGGYARGSSNATGQPGAGTGNFVLRNAGGWFNSFNPASILKWYIGVPVQLGVTIGGTTHWQHSGYIDSVEPDLDPDAGFVITINTVDRLDQLAKAFAPPSWLGYSIMQCNPVAWYRFKEKSTSSSLNSGDSLLAIDSSGNGNHASYNSNTGIAVTAPHGPNPSPDYGMVTQNVGLPPSTWAATGGSVFSIGCTIEVDNSQQEIANSIPQPIFNIGTAGQAGGWTLNLTVGGFTTDYELSLIWYDASNNPYVITTSFPNANALLPGSELLVHIVRNGTSLSLYQSNKLIGTVTIPAGTFTFPLSIIPNGGPGGASYPGQFYGAVGEFAVYTTALTPTQIALQNLYYSDAPQLTSDWVTLALTAAGLTSADWNIEAGLTSLVEPDAGSQGGNAQIGGQDVRTVLQQAAADERGLLFVDGSGKINFLNRLHCIQPANKVPVASLGSASGAWPLEKGYKPRVDSVNLITEAAVIRAGGVEQVGYGPSTLRSRYGQRTGRLSGSTNVRTDAEALQLAQQQAFQQSSEKWRFPRVSFKPWSAGSAGGGSAAVTAAWLFAAQLELWQAVTISSAAPDGSGATLTVNEVIQGINVKFDTVPGKAEWVITMDLAPQDTTNYLIIQDATYGDPTANYFPY
jgi:hypothetical protein